MRFPVRASITMMSAEASSRSLPLITTPPSLLDDSAKLISYPFSLSFLSAISVCLAPSILAIPTVGFSTPEAFAAIIPYTAFFTIDSTRSVEEVPVVVAK